MARQKKEVVEEKVDSGLEATKSKAAAFLKKFRDTNKLASVLSESRLSNIKRYIPSGSYTLNKVISGSYLKGWPDNRIMCIGGACVDSETLLTVEINGVTKDMSIGELHKFLESEENV